MDVVAQGLGVAALLQDLHGPPKGAHTREHQLARRSNVGRALHLRRGGVGQRQRVGGLQGQQGGWSRGNSGNDSAC